MDKHFKSFIPLSLNASNKTASKYQHLTVAKTFLFDYNKHITLKITIVPLKDVSKSRLLGHVQYSNKAKLVTVFYILLYTKKHLPFYI